MKGGSNSQALDALRSKIREPGALDAFDRLTGFHSAALTSGPGGSGRNADFRYTSAEPRGWPFALAVSRAQLLFCVRPLGVRRLGVTRASLSRLFSEVRKRNDREWQIVVRNRREADAVVEHLLSRWPDAIPDHDASMTAAQEQVPAQAGPVAIVQAVDAAQRGIWERTDIGPDEKRSLLGARLGHGIYRANVEQVEGACRVTGTMDRRHLRAVHVKPWRDCTDSEKLDGHNGLMLSPHIAHLFERGYITFSDDGSLVVSQTLNSRVLKQWGIAPVQARPFTPAQRPYLAWHRQQVYEKVETGKRRKKP